MEENTDFSLIQGEAQQLEPVDKQEVSFITFWMTFLIA